VLFANRAEAAAVLGNRAASRLPRLLDLAPLVVVKEGPEGSRLLWRDTRDSGELDIATTPLTADDTTGAGDGYAAGFLFVLLGSTRPWSSSTLRRAALAGHRSAVALLRTAHRPELIV
jgi:sugar/nucleoside kinase (ribokinase family)